MLTFQCFSSVCRGITTLVLTKPHWCHYLIWRQLYYHKSASADRHLLIASVPSSCSTQPCSCISTSPVPQTTPCGCKLARLGPLYSAKVNWTNGRWRWQFSLSVFRGAGVLQEPQDRGTGQVGLQHGLFWEIASRYCCWVPEAQRELCSERATGDMLKFVAWEKQILAAARAWDAKKCEAHGDCAR